MNALLVNLSRNNVSSSPLSLCLPLSLLPPALSPSIPLSPSFFRSHTKPLPPRTYHAPKRVELPGAGAGRVSPLPRLSVLLVGYVVLQPHVRSMDGGETYVRQPTTFLLNTSACPAMFFVRLMPLLADDSIHCYISRPYEGTCEPCLPRGDAHFFLGIMTWRAAYTSSENRV